ncbi:hypothetical protein CARUB_v10003746mg [Capsella rubella]|uniref:DUF3444 domain-containing protein n=2 Tax=Capsella rubella TaxID=81985 RepID=R0H1D1_9BRAS|nr:hypothetical protein CARUB_v10003746mg [Capsella rubella]
MTDIASSEDSVTCSSSCAVSVGEKRKRNEYGGSCNSGNQGVLHNHRRGLSDNGDAGRGEESAKPKTSEYVGPKFNDFDKLREEMNFAVGQTWALYDTTDGMPRSYAQIRKVSAPSFGLRITYLEPDPDDEKEILWFEEDLPVSVGKFRLANNQNTKVRSRFSHLIQSNEGISNGYFTISPRKGETWALFKNWDINWSSKPDSHRKFEYEFVEILSDYADGAGVSIAFLHKAKGFASVFFRMGTGDVNISQILPHRLYQFSHRVPSFKLTGTEGQGVPKDAYELDKAVLPDTIKEILVPSHLLAAPTALKSKLTGSKGPGMPKGAYELDQAVLPETIKEIIVPSHLLAAPTALKSKLTGSKGQCVPKDAYELDQAVLPETIKETIVPSHLLAVPTALKSKPEAFCFRSTGKGFQTGQIWSYYTFWSVPRHYCRIHKITFTQAFEQEAVFKLHVTRLMPTHFSGDATQYRNKKKTVGCGTFFVRKGTEVIDPDDVSHQIVPETETFMDGYAYTILPKIGDVWAIYTYLPQEIYNEETERWYFYKYEIVEVLDDTLDYKVSAVELASFGNENEEKQKFLQAAEGRQHESENESEAIITIPKSKRQRFSHQIPVSRVTKAIDGDLKELFEVLDAGALP